MKRRLIPILAQETLATMPTKQLLGRLRSLHQCEESAALSDRVPEEVATGDGIFFKDSAEWQRAYTELKGILRTREHTPSGAESAQARKLSNKRAGGGGGTARLQRAPHQQPAAPHHGR
jgi:hypothetical protein